MPLLYPVLYGLTLVSGTTTAYFFTKKPADGSVFDSVNDGVNTLPTIAKWTAVGTIATALATVYVKSKGK